LRRIALAAVLLAACSSSSDLIDTEMVDCAEAGNEVSIMLSHAQVETSPSSMVAIPNPQVTIEVEVSNNSHADIVVKNIVLIPRNNRDSVFMLNNAYGKFDQTIAEGKDHVFTLRTTGQWRRTLNELGERPAASSEVEARVTLGNGQIYRCSFSLPVG
jgi:hypothetical protein